MSFSSAEYESIGLCIAMEAINDMANHTMLQVSDLDSLPGQAEVRFQSRIHQGLFLSRLLDFVHENGNAELTGVNSSCLGVLEAACETRSFEYNCSASSLAEAALALRTWLNAQTTLKLWLPTLDIDAVLKLPRIDYLYIAGNQAKHNLARLTAVAKRIGQILNEHGYDPPLQLIPLALDDFKAHLGEHFFAYYGTWLAELLNNLRWGLQEYLKPAFDRAYTRGPRELAYQYRFPETVRDPIAREWFWRLMNHVRAEPYFHRFVGASYMKRDSLGPGSQ